MSTRLLEWAQNYKSRMATLPPQQIHHLDASWAELLKIAKAVIMDEKLKERKAKENEKQDNL